MKIKRQSKMFIVGVAVVALIIVGIVVIAFATNGGTNKYDTQLDMAQKYLDELNYEQAIVELRVAIEIEPNNSAAYFTLAEVYVAMEEYESAIAVLEEGYAVTGDVELVEEKERIVGEYAELQRRQREEEQRREYAESQKRQREQEQRVEEFYEKYAGLCSFTINEVFGRSRGTFERYLTYAEYEEAYGVLVEQLEQYLEELGEVEGLSEELYSDYYIVDIGGEDTLYYTEAGAYENLADFYLRMGNLEECLRVRTEYATLYDRPDLVWDGNYGFFKQTVEQYDRYGRVIQSTLLSTDDEQTIITYGELHEGESHITYICPEYQTEDDFTYDNEGRIIHWHRSITYINGDLWIRDTEYDYTGNNSFVETITDSSGAVNRKEQSYDKYGYVIEP